MTSLLTSQDDEILAHSPLLPTRFFDVYFYGDDKLNVRHFFRYDDEDETPIDVSSSTFEVKSHGLTNVQLPEIDMTKAAEGVIYLRWTKENVALLPTRFSLTVAESSTFAQLGDETWDDLDPDITWDDFPDATWDASAIFDRTILIGRFIRNVRGRRS